MMVDGRRSSDATPDQATPVGVRYVLVGPEFIDKHRVVCGRGLAFDGVLRALTCAQCRNRPYVHAWGRTLYRSVLSVNARL